MSTSNKYTGDGVKKSGETTYKFEVHHLSPNLVRIQEVGKPDIAYIKGDYRETFKDLDILGSVFHFMSAEYKRDYNDSIVQFIDFALHHPEEMAELREKVGNSRLATWSIFPIEPTGSVH